MASTNSFLSITETSARYDGFVIAMLSSAAPGPHVIHIDPILISDNLLLFLGI